MISDVIKKQHCFVSIVLPGTSKAIIAGRYQLQTMDDGSSIGRFVYGKNYLSNPNSVPIDPIELNLTDRQVETASTGGAFGALRDAAPDAWGRYLVAKKTGRSDLTEIDYMLLSSPDRLGALDFEVEPKVTKKPSLMALADLQHLYDDITRLDSNIENRIAAELAFRAGTSLGGARPKITIEHQNAQWLAKFSRQDDRWNNPRVEHATMLLALKCGINCAQTAITQVGDRDVLLVKRFDRQKFSNTYSKTRTISALTAMHVEENQPGDWSYLSLIDVLTKISQEKLIGAESVELFKRICFNCLVSNIDDHPRNHALMALAHGGWGLSPAYDLTPSPSISEDRRNLAMSFGKWGRHANKDNLLSNAAMFGLSKEDAGSIIDEMKEIVVNHWHDLFRLSGVSQDDCETIQSAFSYAGFGYSLDDLGSRASWGM